MRRFVIVVDTQRDFMAPDGALSVTGADALIEPMEAWLAKLNPAETEGVLFTFDTHDPDVYATSPEAAAFPIHCVRGTAGWSNMLDPALLDPAIPAWRIEKAVFDMWAEPALTLKNARSPRSDAVRRDTFFEALKARRVEAVIVIGVAADYCVRWAIDGLVSRGFSVTVPAGLTRGIDRTIEQVKCDDFAQADVHIA
ncbi:cysteine hydrolase family protein [Sphingomonas sp. MMS24-J13]|uniref:cysteine hydrolase family protein n=1 Tax=Sphingomonas sp. MMS24-J13 TaxID=3238686 RepID=UPI00384A5E87